MSRNEEVRRRRAELAAYLQAAQRPEEVVHDDLMPDGRCGFSEDQTAQEAVPGSLGQGLILPVGHGFPVDDGTMAQAFLARVRCRPVSVHATPPLSDQP